MDEHPAAPMRAARHRLHPPSVDLDMGVAVAVPLPALRRADRVRYQLAEHLRQWPAPHAQQRQREAVDPDIVVFPERARFLQVAVRALFAARGTSADAAVAVDQVRLAPQLALPFRGLR